MNLAQFVSAAWPIAAIMVAGFGAIWYAVHRGLTDIRKEVSKIAERVARIEGQLNAPRPPMAGGDV